VNFRTSSRILGAENVFWTRPNVVGFEKSAEPAWIAKFDACLKHAAEAGDLREVPMRRDLRVWFVQHIAFSLMLNLHPKVPAIDYDADRDALVEQATWFALLGVGLEEKAIRRYYDPKALAPLAR
jgi:hypothetical protein